MRVTRSRGPRGGCRRLSRPDLSLHVAWKPDNRTLSGPGPPPSGSRAQRVPTTGSLSLEAAAGWGWGEPSGAPQRPGPWQLLSPGDHWVTLSGRRDFNLVALKGVFASHQVGGLSRSLRPVRVALPPSGAGPPGFSAPLQVLWPFGCSEGFFPLHPWCPAGRL